jgi:hypothetical protein
MHSENLPQHAYKSAEEIEILVRKFESCELPLAEFKHRAHLIVALRYQSSLTEREATERMREGLLRFISHHGETGYHETMTLFWLKIVRRFLEEAGAGCSLHILANQLIEARGNSRLIFDYYSKDLIASEEARRTWVEPDLKPLDF